MRNNLILRALVFSSLLLAIGACQQKKTVPVSNSYYPKAQDAFRIVSYNVGALHKYIADVNENADMIGAMVQEVQADVVGLQELDSCNARHNVNEIDLLARAAGGWKWYYGKTLDYKGGAYGNGIITPSGVKVVKTGKINFANPTKHESRGMIFIETDKYVLAVSHLDHSTEEYIQSQIAEINAWVQENYADAKKPVFFCGDMNATPGSDAIKALEEHWEVISNQGVEGGTTVNTHRTIDFIFHYKRSTPVQVLGATTLVLFHNGDANKASDHYPIYVDVKW